MDWTTTTTTVVASYGPPGVLALLLLRRLARSRPARALGQVVATDISFRYLRLRGVPEKERLEWVKRQIEIEQRDPGGSSTPAGSSSTTEDA